MDGKIHIPGLCPGDQVGLPPPHLVKKRKSSGLRPSSRPANVDVLIWRHARR